MNSYIELVEFGMKDVNKLIEAELIGLDKFQGDSAKFLTLNYLNDIVSENYSFEDTNRITNLTDVDIDNTLQRIDNSIFSAENRAILQREIRESRGDSQNTERQKIMHHYFLKIFDFQKSFAKKEERIRNFCNICCQYIIDKEFIYDDSNFKFIIQSKDGFGGSKTLSLSQLSSGEKQIVSLFGHLYLSGKDRFFVLIDEPELSLSVPWQRKLLPDIRNSNFCIGLVAVTHSPFTYENNLINYAYSLGEFVNYDR